MAQLAGSAPKTSVLHRIAAGGNWQACILTWYDPALGGTNSASGKPDPHSATASGEPYDPKKDTCAAPPSYPFGTLVTFRYQGREVSCRVNDRGGAIQGEHFDLSRHAAETLGIINSGRVAASFVIGGSAGASRAANAAQGAGAGSGGGGGPGGGVNVIQVLIDILTMNINDLARQVAIAGVYVAKDFTLGIADWIIIPFWQWNQRAVDYYTSQELFSKDQSNWTVTPWTAAFWGLGYWLLWTEPGSGSMKPAPVRRSRLAKHVRTVQAIPARRQLVKPKDVGTKTLKKPKPAISTARVTQTGTMRADRTLPVKVSGTHVVRSETRISKTGEAVPPNPTAGRESHSQPRTGDHSLPDSSAHSRSDTRRGPGSGRGNP